MAGLKKHNLGVFNSNFRAPGPGAKTSTPKALDGFRSGLIKFQNVLFFIIFSRMEMVGMG